ncbi:MAG: hypothetical protein DI570_05380 [Phenylobacterium zucineum]|nr:MAG: hypothetical protein DI570_05380 [Phenylobacterium zucineum]
MISKTVSRALLAGLIAAPLNVATFAAPAAADDYVRCESRDNRYQTCPISAGKHGYVRLNRQLGRHPCVQGRSWDYDKRRIWVDDNCRGEFVVEGRDGGGVNKGAAAAAVIGALVIGAAIASANKKDKDRDNYDDDGYYGGGHASYVAPWMEGEFAGYNTRYNEPVDLSISRDGRVTVRAKGQSVKGYVNGGRLYVGDHEFYLTRVADGVQTSQVDDPGNTVVYRRR